MKPLTLSEFLEKYVDEHQLKASTEEHYRYTVQQFEKVVCQPGRSLGVQDITAKHVNLYLRELEANGRTYHTIKGRRNNMLILWREARRQQLNSHPDDCVRKLRPVQVLVEAWSTNEVRKLKKTAESWVGSRFLEDGTDEGLYFLAYICTGWDSGLRRGDLWTLPSRKVSPRFWWIQAKTGGKVLVELHQSTLDRIDRLAQSGPKRACPMAWPYHKRTFSKHANELIKEAGLTGTLKYLRRGCGTDLATKHQDLKIATKKLGHRSEEVTRRSYVPEGWEQWPTMLPEEL